MAIANIHLAHAAAYSRKESLGGGYRGAAQNKLTKEIKRGEVRDTLTAAKADAKRFVFEFANGRNMVTGTYRSPKGEWKCNYFIRSDEVDV